MLRETNYLGRLCKRNHNWNNTGKSLRSKRNRTCLECANECCKRLYKKADYRQKISQQQKDKYRNNGTFREQAILRARRWYGQPLNKIRQQARRKRRYALNPIYRKKVNASNKRRVEYLKTIGCPFTETELKQHLEIFSGCCAYCGRNCSNDNRLLRATTDHFVPLSKGGSNTLDNLVLACLSCNSSKHTSDPFNWFKRQKFFSVERWNFVIEALSRCQTPITEAHHD